MKTISKAKQDEVWIINLFLIGNPFVEIINDCPYRKTFYISECDLLTHGTSTKTE